MSFTAARPVRDVVADDGGDHDDDDDNGNDDGNDDGRALELADVLIAAQSAWSTRSDELQVMAEKLGDDSRHASWRIPLGESGLLDFFLNLLSVDELRQPLKRQALRVIGNCCADTDENRARVVQSGSLPSLIRLLADDSLLSLVVPVLYNMLVDYEPAQEQASSHHLSRTLIDMMSGPRLSQCRNLLGLTWRILELLMAQVASLETPAILLRLAMETQTDSEDGCGLVTVALAYLANEKFQIHFVDTDKVSLLQQTWSHFHTPPVDAAFGRPVSAAFLQIVADISALPCFAARYPLGSPVTGTFLHWLDLKPPLAPLQMAACLALGNLCRSDAASTKVIGDVHGPLRTILDDAAGRRATQLLHAALSFLRNLAIPPANKAVLGDLLRPDASVLPRLWAATDTQPDVQFAAVSLTRLASAGCPENVALLCAPLPPGAGVGADPVRSNLHGLLDLAARADAQPIRIEIGRLVVAVCRLLHTTNADDVLSTAWDEDGRRPGDGDGDDTMTTRRARFHAAHHGLHKPLHALLEQAKWPTVRSEALFVLALMSRSPDGVRVARAAVTGPAAMHVLRELVTGPSTLEHVDGEGSRPGSGPGAVANVDHMQELVRGLSLEPRQTDASRPVAAAAAALEKVNRENALVLVSEILKRCDGHLEPRLGRDLADLLAKGGERVLRDRDTQPA